jgi:hypothetical protein
MVRATKIGSVVVGLAASGLTWGQTALTPPAPNSDPPGKIITVNEAGKPAQKCRLIKMWTQPSGGKACQVQAIDSGHIMTIVQSAPATGGDGKTMAMTIYHWTGNTPHPDAPMPPTTMVTSPVMRTAATTMQQSEPMPAGTPAVTSPAISSAFMRQPMPPQHAPAPMTPGGVVLTPAPTVHDGSGSAACGDCGTCDACTTCKPSLFERIKGCFHRDCSTSCCKDACTTCTTDSAVPAKTAGGETIVPVPPPAPAPAPAKPTPVRTTSSLFRRQRLDGDNLKDEMPRADVKKPDPLKDPAAYSPSKTTAELAVTSTQQTEQAKEPKINEIPLGAGSVMAAGDPSFIPVPIITLPDANRSPRPPVAELPRGPQPNQRFIADAHAKGTVLAAPPVAMGEMTGNAFGANPYAGAMSDGAFHHGMPNARGYTTPGFTPPGYGGMGYGQMLPQAPVGAAVQPGYYGPPRGQMIAPAGYQMQMYVPQCQPMMQPAAPDVDVQSLLNQMRNSMLPSQREWAAQKLAELDCRQQPSIIDSLVESAKGDPAASVRAGCIHCLVKMNVCTPPVMAAMKYLCSDPDSRVQREASEALARFAPSMATDSAVQPAGAILQPPPRSN